MSWDYLQKSELNFLKRVRTVLHPDVCRLQSVACYRAAAESWPETVGTHTRVDGRFVLSIWCVVLELGHPAHSTNLDVKHCDCSVGWKHQSLVYDVVFDFQTISRHSTTSKHHVKEAVRALFLYHGPAASGPFSSTPESTHHTHLVLLAPLLPPPPLHQVRLAGMV